MAKFSLFYLAVFLGLFIIPRGVLSQTLTTCPKSCGENGVCGSTGVCLCNDGWEGDDCTVPSFAAKHCKNDCSQNGICRNGICQCNPGFILDDCSQKDPCYQVTCSGRGTCSNGVCTCNPGFIGNDCSQVDPCYNKVCLNNGVCQAGVCVCKPGFLGADCGVKDPCFGVNCQNGGTCSNGVCSCPAGFLGADCGVRDPCFGVSCKNGGVCSQGRCNCPAGFLGADCGTRDPCFGVNCRNGGSCANGVCNCPAGFLGADCGVRDPCFGVTCRNGGSCANGVCNCPAGFLGADCGTRDPCFGVTCRNGGSCAQGRCNCPAGFLGADCGTRDPCFGVTCRNGGSCANGVCNCPAGFLGADCGVRDPCFGVVCRNGGSCAQGRCNCPAGFLGADCGTRDPCFGVTCRNGGSCANGVCNCPAGFLGSQCETRDPCFGVSCQNGGRCDNGRCLCAARFAGASCELRTVRDSAILSAFYGTLDVTGRVQNMYDQGQRTFVATNAVWGDPNFGIRKVLIVIYQEGNQVKHLVADEWNQFFSNQLTLPQLADPTTELSGPIIYAVYGSRDVTAEARRLYSQRREVFESCNCVWGDPNFGLQKWMYIFYLEQGQIIRGKGAYEYGHKSKPDRADSPIGQVVFRHSPILSAYYGTKDVTADVQNKYAQGVRRFFAHNSWWGDPNPGIRKVLVVVYQEGTTARVLVSDEWGRFNQNFLDLPNLGIPMLGLSRGYIVAAVYGSSDITTQVINRYNSNRFMMASNSYWGDPNYGHEKWLYIFYLWGDQVRGIPAYEYGFLHPVKMFWVP